MKVLKVRETSVTYKMLFRHCVHLCILDYSGLKIISYVHVESFQLIRQK